MPLVRISVPSHRSAADRKAISAGIHAALQEAFNVPADDLFHLVSEHEPDGGIARSARSRRVSIRCVRTGAARSS